MTSEGTARWTVTVETVDGFTQSTEVLERVAGPVESDVRALGPALSLDTTRGAVSATFQVEGGGPGAAAAAAIDVFYRAITAAGYDVTTPGWKLSLEVEPSADRESPVPA
jgi:hypothetical protein